jgi:protocatechuate 3,4-dioxygenase alpha subunit
VSPHATASQTVGPFFDIGLEPLYVDDLAARGATGERVTIRGRVLDGDGRPVTDAMIETWQADARGRYAHPDDTRDEPRQPAFKGFGRMPTDDDGAFRLTTIKPGRVPGPGGSLQAPHLVVALFMRGLLEHLVTRIYFPDEPSNGEDPVLTLVAPERRATLIAKRAAGGPGELEWNVVLQGRDETVFFDY